MEKLFKFSIEQLLVMTQHISTLGKYGQVGPMFTLYLIIILGLHLAVI